MANSEELYPMIYTLEDEDGNEMQFELLHAAELEGETYYAMIPYHEDPEELLQDDGEIIVLKGEMSDDEELLCTIDDQDEYERIGAIMIGQINALLDEEELTEE